VTREQEMFIQFKWGSTWQLIGSDAYDATVGAGPVGIAYSEWALANPSAWAYHRPMLEESRGKAAFITTPRGNNHAKAMFDYAERTPRWFSQVLTVEETKALTPEQLEEALSEYQSLYGIDFGRAYFEQEYLCSFSGAMVGAYFGAEMAKAEREGRIKPVPVLEALPVHTVWDLGKAVNNPIWCFQVIGQQLRVVDFYIPESEDIEEWVRWLDERGYKGNDYVPHDIVVTEWGSKRTRFETLVSLGRKPVRIPKVSVADGLQAGRVAINAACFDEERTAYGREGLKAYRREWDDEFKTFKENPVKDWAEHIGSAWRYLGLAWKEVRPQPVAARKAEPPVPRGHVRLHLPGPPAPVEGRRIKI
jgi:phage terminase large subunit